MMLQPAETPADDGSEDAPSREREGAEPTSTEDLSTEVFSVRDGSHLDGELPPVSSDAALPVITKVLGPVAVTNGGTAILHVTLSAPVESPTFVVQLSAVPGYHSVQGIDSDGDATYDIAIQIPGNAQPGTLVATVSLLDAAGNRGPSQELQIQLVESGVGDVKVTLSFDRLHDLDLHVVEPSGDEIFYERPTSITNGQLDLDSGANCEATPANTENVFWPPGGAPRGQYRVFVQNFQSCVPGPIAFKVRIAYGTVVEQYDGTFADGTAAEAAGTGNVFEVTTFELAP